MTLLAPLITGFLRDYMPRQRGYSPHSCETYAYSFRLWNRSQSLILGGAVY
jgi:integrase/recombinase XerD